MAIDPVFSAFPILTTERLLLREMDMKDNPAFFAIFSDPAVMQYMDFSPPTSTDFTRRMIERSLEQFQRKEAINWVITRHEDTTAIGVCNISHIDGTHHHAEIGYYLLSSAWSQGIMREAATAILTYAFEHLELHRIEAITASSNAASKKLLESLGFVYEGCFRQRTRIQATYKDDAIFGLLRDEWVQQPTK